MESYTPFNPLQTLQVFSSIVSSISESVLPLCLLPNCINEDKIKPPAVTVSPSHKASVKYPKSVRCPDSAFICETILLFPVLIWL